MGESERSTAAADVDQIGSDLLFGHLASSLDSLRPASGPGLRCHVGLISFHAQMLFPCVRNYFISG